MSLLLFFLHCLAQGLENGYSNTLITNITTSEPAFCFMCETNTVLAYVWLLFSTMRSSQLKSLMIREDLLTRPHFINSFDILLHGLEIHPFQFQQIWGHNMRVSINLKHRNHQNKHFSPSPLKRSLSRPVKYKIVGKRVSLTEYTGIAGVTTFTSTTILFVFNHLS